MTLSKKLLVLGAFSLLPWQALATPTTAPAPAKPGTVTTTKSTTTVTKDKDKEGRVGKSDTNKDGMISKAEFMAEADSRFKELDANNDGNITKDEMRAQHEKMKARMASKTPPAAGTAKK